METSMMQEVETSSVLGPFCKLTEVHLWDDDDSVEVQSGSISESDKPIHIDNSGSSDGISEFLQSSEDLELARQMNELGLPVSFQTNKEKRTASGGKKKNSKKNLHRHKEINDLSSVRECVEVDVSSTVINGSESYTLSSISMPGVSEQSYSDVEERNNTFADEVCNHVLHYGSDYDAGLPNDLRKSDSEVEFGQRLDNECSSGSCLIDDSTDEKKIFYAYTEASVMENNEAHSEILLNDVNDELVHESQAAAYSQSMELVDIDTADSNNRGAFGDWKVHWDPHYKKIFFHNIFTLESAWDPPPGLEAHWTDNVTFTKSNGFSYDNFFQINNGRKNKETTNEVKQRSSSISKYYNQRYSLFSRFDEGIQMDEEGWFSVTAERIAKHHASRCAGGVIVDCFAGVGGNAIQFAQRCQHVIAIDIDPRKIDYARHNAAVYGVEDLIDFVTGDCTLVAPKFKADTIFLSPPWGGPDYAKLKVYDINVMLQPYNGRFLFEVAKLIAPKVVMFLPKNVDVSQLAELALSASPSWSLEVESNYLNGKLKAITAYFTQHAA